MTSTEDFLFGGGGGSAKFENVGDTISGTITATEVKQQTDLVDNKPKTWDNGDPVMQLVVTLQTAQRDPENPDDAGLRNVYVKGSKKPGSKSLHDAVATAVKASGSKGLEVGGTLSVTYTGEEPSSTRGFNPRKLYSATYAGPDKAAQTGDFLGTATSAPQAVPVAAPAAPVMTPEQLAAFAAYQASQQPPA